ncbi:response regulator transcription factor [Gluconobacter sp. R71646]|uniref:Response regulator transcription factor n=1 Tax=Gluconobacter potus TaxID=2724927 RepID=A0ABR9YJ20_9PROT|nr:response regulator transcription factor [Gluconobacter sp. R75690]MBF0863270.1 response regulator transcription factor [Gluconobacter sp. R71656]MBF0867424.1 response regulator transcription factor [Gluconobacter sp. R75628]MBF0873778.1 response regulator transcription factor [Gluconobacter sp. R75629]MBF0879564.1 response regulator transcription factor [Gluconobacter sp. R75828]MBF0881762.1 response regulator transcription factor [Gluconobacter potus]
MTMTSVQEHGVPERTVGSSPRLLLIEDDDSIAAEVAEELTTRGYEVTRAATGVEGLDHACMGQFDLMIVDRMLPELDGLTVIESVRAQRINIPVLVLSALSAVDDRVSGLKAGGDDYLTKPFAMEELAARLEALLRRPTDSRVTMLRVGPLEMDLIERRVFRNGQEIDLLPREFRLLEYMMRRPDTVLTRTMLLEDVWNYRFVPQTNLVDVHIGKLRRKIDLAGEPPLIHSIRGAGFSLRVPG